MASYLQTRYGANPDAEHNGRQLAGWYLQQFAKLGAASVIRDLTDYYVLWDLDMILLKPVQIIWQEGMQTKTLVNVGGATAKGYIMSYMKLFDTRWAITGKAGGCCPHIGGAKHAAR